MGAFQGELNPLNSRSIYLTCILPILLYGCENWILNDSLLDRLDRIQAWAGKRMLGLTKSHNNTVVPIALDLPSTCSMILVKKLKFLAKLTTYKDLDHTSLSRSLFAALAMKDAYNISLVSQCLFLEEAFGSNFTIQCLEQPDEATHILSSCSDTLHASSKSAATQKARDKPNLQHFIKVDERYSWMKLWDGALDFGVQGTKACQLTLKLLTLRSFGQTCNVCNGALNSSSTLLNHACSF